MKKNFVRAPRAPQAFELETKKSLGQHFLRDESVVRKIVDAAEATLTASDTEKNCVEIGPGPGILTLPLLKDGWQVTAIEKDPRAVKGLNETLGNSFEDSFKVYEQDILKWVPEITDEGQPLPLCLGNLPYYISSPIFLWFCENYTKFTHGIFMVQDEVADRVASKIGTKDYGRLTVRMQLFFDIEKLFVVGPKSFSPPPRVNSAVIKLTPKGFSFASPEEDKAFSAFTAFLFSSRRKMLRRTFLDKLSQMAVKHVGIEKEFWDFIGTLGIAPESRPDVIPPTTVLKMHKFFWDKKMTQSETV